MYILHYVIYISVDYSIEPNLLPKSNGVCVFITVVSHKNPIDNLLNRFVRWT